jgi:hypothetical protein
MMSGAIAVGLFALLFMFLVSYWFFKLGELGGLQHFFLQLLMVGFLLFGSSVLGVAGLDASRDCQWVIDEIDETTDPNYYAWKYKCLEDAKGYAVTFNTVLTWFWRLITVYMFLWLLFSLLDYLGKLPKGMRRNE